MEVKANLTLLCLCCLLGVNARLVLKHGRLIIEEDEGGGQHQKLLSIQPLALPASATTSSLPTTTTPSRPTIDYSLLTFQAVANHAATTPSTATTSSSTTTSSTTTPITTRTTTAQTTAPTTPSQSSIAAERFKHTFAFLKHTPAAGKEFRVHFVEFQDGNYTGELNPARQRHGWGEIYWRAGALYGPGQMFIYSEGDRYVGQWQNNLQHGNAINPN